MICPLDIPPHYIEVVGIWKGRGGGCRQSPNHVAPSVIEANLYPQCSEFFTTLCPTVLARNRSDLVLADYSYAQRTASVVFQQLS